MSARYEVRTYGLLTYGVWDAANWRWTSVTNLPYDEAAAECGLLNTSLGRCADCGLPLVPGAREEAAHPRAVGADGRLRYFCGTSADALHHPLPAAESCHLCSGTADGLCVTCGRPVCDEDARMSGYDRLCRSCEGGA